MMLSRGHLSRPACSHVKQVAKRPGTRRTRRRFSGRVFCWAEESLMSASAKRSYRPETELVHAGILRSQFGETSEALFLTQGYVYESSVSAEKRFKNEEPGYQYSRFSNPTVSMFEARMAALEGAEAARATATGMAAVNTALMGQVRAGDHVFSTPLYQHPLQLGADCVVYSATKHIDGQGRCLGGVILASEKFIQDNIHNLIRQTGPSLSPFNAWVLLKGLETLSVRVARQTETAATVLYGYAKHPDLPSFLTRR